MGGQVHTRQGLILTVIAVPSMGEDLMGRARGASADGGLSQ
jgi:hypothetical protein